jgi:hypothetical protein
VRILDIKNTIEPDNTAYDPFPIDNLDAVVTCIGRKAVKKRIIIPIKKGVKYFTFFESVLITLNNNNNNKMIPMIVVSNL